MIQVVELVTVQTVIESVSGYDGASADAPGGGSPRVVGRAGRAEPIILAKAVTIAAAHGQFDGIRSLRLRPPVA